MPEPTQTKPVVPPIIACKTCPYISAVVSMPILWLAVSPDYLFFSFNYNLVKKEICKHLYLLNLSLSFTFLISHFTPSSHHFLFGLAHFCLRWPVFLFHSHSDPVPPSPSFALCVWVCRWLLLTGSVTRGNWGRVHFSGTNGNKLIHVHGCLCDDVQATDKKM